MPREGGRHLPAHPSKSYNVPTRKGNEALGKAALSDSLPGAETARVSLWRRLQAWLHIHNGMVLRPFEMA
jgi:hypothetical protein